MTDKPASYFTDQLLSLYPGKTAFTLIVLHKKPKTKMGTYIWAKCKIRIYDGWGDTRVCLETAIHEYAHHLHYTEFGKQGKKQKPHGKEFWQIYGQLMALAKEKINFEYGTPTL